MVTFNLSPSSSVSTTLTPSRSQTPASGNPPSYQTISSAPSNVTNPTLPTFNDPDLRARADEADHDQRQSIRIFLLAFLISGGTGFIKWLKNEPGFPPMYAFCAVSIPIALVFYGLKLCTCASFTRDEIREELQSRQEREERLQSRIEIIGEAETDVSPQNVLA